MTSIEALSHVVDLKHSIDKRLKNVLGQNKMSE